MKNLVLATTLLSACSASNPVGTCAAGAVHDGPCELVEFVARPAESGERSGEQVYYAVYELPGHYRVARGYSLASNQVSAARAFHEAHRRAECRYVEQGPCPPQLELRLEPYVPE